MLLVRKLLILWVLWGVRYVRGEILRPEHVVVSLSIDSTSLEIQREALRLLTSIAMLGGDLQRSHFHICINHEFETENTEIIAKANRVLLERIKMLEFESLSISYAKTLSESYSASLNKMCAFDPAVHFGEDRKYLLYLDADVFVASDPLPLLSQHLPLNRNGDIFLLCGRPFTSAHDTVSFQEFFGIPNNPFLDIEQYEPLATLNGGYSYYGMCNTGVYFMEIKSSRKLKQVADEYLQRTTTVWPDITRQFLIDSFILWSAQQMLNYKIDIFSPRLNFLVPAEDFYEEYLLNELSEISHTQSMNDNTTDIMQISLFQFSRGSDLKFSFSNANLCYVILRQQIQGLDIVHNFVRSLFAEDSELCAIFYYMLEPFIEFVSLRDDNATAYFR